MHYSQLTQGRILDFGFGKDIPNDIMNACFQTLQRHRQLRKFKRNSYSQVNFVPLSAVSTCLLFINGSQIYQKKTRIHSEQQPKTPKITAKLFTWQQKE